MKRLNHWFELRRAEAGERPGDYLVSYHPDMDSAIEACERANRNVASFRACGNALPPMLHYILVHCSCGERQALQPPFAGDYVCPRCQAVWRKQPRGWVRMAQRYAAGLDIWG